MPVVRTHGKREIVVHSRPERARRTTPPDINHNMPLAHLRYRQDEEVV